MTRDSPALARSSRLDRGGWWVGGAIAGLGHAAMLLAMTTLTPPRTPTPPVTAPRTVAVELVDPVDPVDPTMVGQPARGHGPAPRLTPGAPALSRRPRRNRRLAVAIAVAVASDANRRSAPTSAPISAPAATGGRGTTEVRVATTPMDGGEAVLAVPHYLHHPPPAYPKDCLRRHQEGVALLNVAVGADGRALRVSLKQSSGHSLLDQAAIRAVCDWTFDPARRAGQPVWSRVLVPVRFSMTQP